MTDDYSDQNQTAVTAPERHRSVMMAISALLTLLVAAWCLADGPFLFSGAGLPWALLAGGIVVGIGLIASGFRRK
ncbi:hypothetical protein [Gordonia hydrophobica]|uniref:Uncharacterized protein n=1 Tax=Gordonia hydrophobica TaxID=40516 RepID=A0ABZ2U4C6_9ACTN|nr:hypothetical protein [Gordonia hydrophobica]MBM7366752.1 hypothetical protein [Gordonia hydrophobica]